MNHKLLVLAVVAMFAATASNATGSGSPVHVTLRSTNGSGQTGVAVLTPTGSGYTVTVQVTGKRVQGGEHDHIHAVSCARYARIAPRPYRPTQKQINDQLATVTVPLNDIYRGRSRTVVTSPLAAVTKGGFSINVHMPGAPYTALACGDIPKV